MSKSPAKVTSQYSGNTYTVGDADSVYKQGLDEGFSVSTAKEYIQNTPGHEEQLAVTLDTPYFYKGKPLTAYAVVDMSAESRANDTVPVRPFNTCELYSGGRNIEDIHNDSKTSEQDNLYIDAPDGVISHGEALDKVGIFAQAASFHEHVMEYDEYKSVFDTTHKRLIAMGMSEPASETGYEQYLDRTKNLMRDGMVYIGEVTKPDDVDKMRFTMPSVADMYHDLDSGEANTCQVVSPDTKNNCQAFSLDSKNQPDTTRECPGLAETSTDIDGVDM